jgi:anti-sigma regulatory factor (Ser/Thr protein kinase)
MSGSDDFDEYGEQVIISTESKIVVPASLHYLEAVLAFVDKVADASGLDQAETQELVLAVEEACSNVIRHALEENPEETFEVRCRPTEAGLTVAICDKGLPFDPNHLPEYSPSEEEPVSTGMGMYLIKQSVDEVRFRNLGRDGKQLLLTKFLTNRRVDRMVPAEELRPFEELSESESKKCGQVPFEVREFTPQDAIEIARCAYRSYGYNYDAFVYYPELLTQMNAEGSLTSLVAANDGGDVMGHLALKFRDDGDHIAEMGVGFVKPRFRRLGVFERLNDRLTEIAHESDLLGVYCRAVTGHSASQIASAKWGFRFCGLVLGALPGVDYKGMGSAVAQRESALLAYQTLGQQEERIIFPPDHHTEVLGDLFSDLGVTVVCREEEAPEPTCERTVIKTKKAQVLNVCEVSVMASGKDLVAVVGSVLTSLCRERIDAVYLFLSLEDPFSCAMVDGFEKLGFFFSGVLPNGLSGEHTLVLQYLNNLSLDIDQLVLVHPSSRRLADYVKARVPNLKV